MPDISVIIPAYNAERFLAAAIDSALQQTLPATEIIVVDDGSTDGTACIVRRYPGVRLLSIAHQGASVARNTGAQGSNGDLLAFLDADDIWLPNKLEQQAELLEHDADAGIAACRHRYLFDGPIPGWFRGPTDGSVAPAFLLIPSLIRRTTWEMVGPFDEKLSHGEDGDWLFRAMDSHVRIAVVDEPLMLYRIHGANASANAAGVREGILRTLRSSVQRKREAGRDD
jgi:glycosyltransferase involved in cell wall biosynthesis